MSLLRQIEALAPKFAPESDDALRQQVADWRAALTQRKTTRRELLVPALALAREAARRMTGLFAYPNQVQGALVLAQGSVAELATGEGKTLVAMLAAFLFALEGRGVHVVTVNTYLAGRDYAFGKPFFEFLNLTAGLLPERGHPDAKREAYLRDVTYGVGYEFGFDYLRDQLALMRQPNYGPTQRLRRAFLQQISTPIPIVQRGLAFAIIDEIDSVLIDEAGSPLVISEAVRAGSAIAKPYQLAHELAGKLVKDLHYTNAASGRNPVLTPEGKQLILDDAAIPWDDLKRPWPSYILNALSAREGFHLDDHYVIRDGKVTIVDTFTGRAHAERSWQRGLHQAIEVKEGVAVQPEMESAASITRQRFFGLYDEISGLTGTAAESAGEFRFFFKLPVQPVPLHRPSKRVVLPDRCFASQQAMLTAVVEEIAARHLTGQPILLGTRTIQISQVIAEALTGLGVPHQLLTAKQDARENEIVHEAGLPGKVLIATNMAGRGTHIDIPEGSRRLGGLHVIGVERNESIRIDRQLIGRGARQGQPGSAQFFVSADDQLLQVYAPALAKTWQSRKGELREPAAKAVLEVQRQAEKLKYQQRRTIAQRDEWIDQTRRILG